MVDPISIGSLNPFSDVNFLGSIGSFGQIALVIIIAFIILASIGILIYWQISKKQYWINIEVSRMVGGHPMRVATYVAKEVPFGMAGDKLWRVCNKGLFGKFKVVKWLPVGKLQSAPRVWKYWIREDGEWINYVDSNLDEESKKMGVKFVQEDMRLQRLAIEKLLEQRLLNKTFWEKWGTTIMTLTFFLVIAVCMVIIFYQYSKLMDKFIQVQDVQLQTSKILYKTFGDNYVNNILNSSIDSTTGLVPAT